MQEFNEQQWLKLLFLLADTQSWLDEMTRDCFSHLPMDGKKKFLRKTYTLTAQTLAHIIERHYFKINRYPHTGKFHIPIVEILHYIREGASSIPIKLNGNGNFSRTIKTTGYIGYDINGNASRVIVIITDASGKIITAYPGSDSEAVAHEGTSTGFFYNEEFWNDEYFESAKQIA